MDSLLSKRPAQAMGSSVAGSASSISESKNLSQNHADKNKKLKTSRPFAGVTSRLTINPVYTAESFRNSVRSLLRAYVEGPNAPADADISSALNYVFRKPFRHMIFPDFFRGPIEDVEVELLSQKFDNLSTDLFQLSQTKELASERVLEFSQVSKTFREDVRPWVQEITGVELTQEVDMRGGRYTYTDRLVCHDDRSSSRKIAYVYYLTQPDWSAEDGGSLDLYESICVNDNLVPGELEKSILPIRNSLVLFFVSDDSFHEVREVLSLTKPRLSLTGWFHTSKPPKPRVEFQDSPESQFFYVKSTTVAEARICRLAKPDDVMLRRAKSKYRSELQKHRAAEVRHLFTEDFYQSLVMEIRQHDHGLPWVIPMNRNTSGRYRYVDIPSDFQWSKEMPHMDHLVNTFFSNQFLQSLTEISGKQLAVVRQKEKTGEKREGVNGTSKSNRQDAVKFAISVYQFRLERFEHGDYTLKHFDAVQMDNVLDIFYFIDCDKLERDCGGSIVFVEVDESPDEDWDPMVQVDGSSNSLSIVGREQGYVFYTEYVNHRWIRRNAGRPFYRVWLSLAIDMEEAAESSSESEQADESSAEEDEIQEPDAVPAALSNSETDEEEEE